MKPLINVGRDEGILTIEEVELVEAQIIEAIHPILKARTIFPVKKLGDAGIMWYKFYEETDMAQASISMYGDNQNDDVPIYNDAETKIPVISKSFHLRWRDILASRRQGLGLDIQAPNNAARQVAEEEDLLALTGEHTGWPALGIEGLSTAFGRNTQASGGAWPAFAYADINNALATLEQDSFSDLKYGLLAPPAMLRDLDQLIANTGITYRQSLLNNKIVDTIIASDNVAAADNGVDSALVVVLDDPMNFVLLEGMPPTVGWWTYKDGDMYGYVRECVAPVIYRPESICEITGVT